MVGARFPYLKITLYARLDCISNGSNVKAKFLNEICERSTNAPICNGIVIYQNISCASKQSGGALYIF